MLDWFLESKEILREDIMLETKGELTLLEGYYFKNANDHWTKHCLVFDEHDPKFPAMSKRKYINRAIELAKSEAKPSTEKEGIIGYMYHQINKKDGSSYDAHEKVLWDSPLHSGYCEQVAYKVEGDDITIYTYMLRKPHKVERELSSKNFLGELPENRVEEEEPQEEQTSEEVITEPTPEEPKEPTPEELMAQKKLKGQAKYNRRMNNKQRR